MLIFAASLALAGCSIQPKLTPTEKLDKEYESVFAGYPDLNSIWRVMEKAHDEYFIKPNDANKSRYLYLYNRYINLVSERDFDITNAQETTRQLQVTWGNQGRAGAVEKQPGYVHVLGGIPTYNNVTPPRKKTTSRKQTKLSPYDLAWSRYCNYGKNLTAEDWKIITQSNNIPAKYMKNCHPPK